MYLSCSTCYRRMEVQEMNGWHERGASHSLSPSIHPPPRVTGSLSVTSRGGWRGCMESGRGCYGWCGWLPSVRLDCLGKENEVTERRTDHPHYSRVICVHEFDGEILHVHRRRKDVRTDGGWRSFITRDGQDERRAVGNRMKWEWPTSIPLVTHSHLRHSSVTEWSEWVGDRGVKGHESLSFVPHVTNGSHTHSIEPKTRVSLTLSLRHSLVSPCGARWKKKEWQSEIGSYS